jgi:hypothetical protein
MRRLIGGILVLVALLVAPACTTTGPGGESDALSVAEPVFLVPESMWRMAHEGCEGLIDEEFFFLARAENEPDLGVIVDGEGDVVCVDTWESIELELDKVMGDPSPDPMRPMGLDGRRRR